MTMLEYKMVPLINPSVRFDYRDNEHILSFRDSNRHFRISNTYFDLLNIIDNKKSVEEIVTEYNNTHADRIDNATAYSLLYEKLNRSDIILTNNIASISFQKPSYLKLSTVIVSAGMTEILSKPFRFLFNRNMLRTVPIACLVILTSIFILRLDDIVNLLGSIPPSMLLAYACLMMLSSIFHEIGHAAATNSFGGKCGSIGFGFYLITPVLYADVSDAWKFDTRKRIIVNLAGIYLELVFCTLATVFAMVSGSKFLLVIPVIIFLKTLFNLNPFLRNDGYWILSDLLRCPNLQSISNTKLKEFLKSFSGKSFSGKDLLLILYSLLNNALIIIFLVSIIVINPSSILQFPANLYDFFIDTITSHWAIDIFQLGKLLIPLTFYYLLIRYLIKYTKKIHVGFLKLSDDRKKK